VRLKKARFVTSERPKVGNLSPNTAGVLAENSASRKTSSKKLRKTAGFDLKRASI